MSLNWLRGAGISWCLGLLAGCFATEVVEPPPLPEDTRTILWVVEDRAWLVDVDSPQAFYFSASPSLFCVAFAEESFRLVLYDEGAARFISPVPQPLGRFEYNGWQWAPVERALPVEALVVLRPD